MSFNLKLTIKVFLIAVFLILPLQSFAACTWKIEQYVQGQKIGGCLQDAEIASDHTECNADTKPSGNIQQNKYVRCCCSTASVAETESIIGGSVWANPFDSLQVKIPGLTEFTTPECYMQDGEQICPVSWIGEYIKGVYNYAIGIAGMLALIAVSVGGLIWLTSGGSVSKITTAKSWIFGGIIGLVLLTTSFLILDTINTKFTTFQPLKVKVPIVREQCPDDLAKKEKCTACNDCTTLQVPTKDGEYANKALAEKLNDAYKLNSNWRVTEAWPPTVAHKDSCHANGTCVDVGLTNTITPGGVKAIYNALVAQGLKVDFEIKSDSDDNCNNYPGISCIDTLDHITGSHFSVYLVK